MIALWTRALFMSAACCVLALLSACARQDGQSRPKWPAGISLDPSVPGEIPSQVLAEQGLPASYSDRDHHGVVFYVTDLTRYERSRRIELGARQLLVLEHPISTDWLVATRRRFTLLDVPCVQGHGPISVWEGGDLLCYSEYYSPWVLADLGDPGSPYLFTETEYGKRDFGGGEALVVFPGTGPATGGRFPQDGFLFLNGYHLRFRLSGGTGAHPPMQLESLDEGKWHEAPSRLVYDPDQGSYRVEGGGLRSFIGD